MNRSVIDKFISSAGLLIGVVLVMASGVLFYAHNFVHSEVTNQLGAQRIYFPAEDSKSFEALSAEDQEAIRPYASEQLTTGVHAKVYSENYINAHLEDIGGGKTYAELSTASRMHPKDTALADKVDTVFRGETLRGMLLNAYAFDTMATVAQFAAYGALVTGTILLLLAALGFNHSEKVKKAPAKKRK